MSPGFLKHSFRLGHALVIPLFILIAAAETSAYDWPLADARIASTFATPLGGYFSPCVFLTSRDDAVRAIGEGEIVFSQEDGIHPAGMPTTLGDATAMIHPEGMVSVYSHLRTGTGASASGVAPVKNQAALGRFGSTGWSSGVDLGLAIYDLKSAHWVNPLLILPAKTGGTAPVILSAILADSSGEKILGKDKTIIQGSYTVAASILDNPPGLAPAREGAPYSIHLTVDGKEVVRLVFDLMWWSDGSTKIFTARPRSWAESRDRFGRYKIADVFLPRGKTTLGIIVEDTYGNRRKAEWTIVVS